MQLAEIAWLRLHHQGLLRPRFDDPADVVAWSGAIQAQDYSGAKWAVAQRLQEIGSDIDLERAFNTGAILRTHVMRPTWHFVTPADIRWMLMLTGPRVHAANAYYYRQLELDEATLGRSQDILIASLEGGRQKTREELADALQAAGIVASGMRLAYVIMHAELEGLLCNGPRRGKQFTYMLLEERVPNAPRKEPDEALAELTKRYFTSHGPALLQDFVWWSGLSASQAREGIALNHGTLVEEVIEAQHYWLPHASAPDNTPTPIGFLLPNYDEALASFKDYRAAVAPEDANRWTTGELLFPHYLVINGWVVGSWKRTLTKRTVNVECKPFAPLSGAEVDALTGAAHKYAQFLDLDLKLQ